MRDKAKMRTTLTIDDDVLTAAKAMATQQHRSVGEVISELARRSLRRPPSSGERNGIPLLSTRPDTPPVTLEIVNAMRDELP
ncbi:CopG family transcriptional regulator [Rhizobium leguminosarum]|nr:CopG family transcriptional regulator [Rhizobium leguminosarum]